MIQHLGDSPIKSEMAREVVSYGSIASVNSQVVQGMEYPSLGSFTNSNVVTPKFDENPI